MAPQGGNTGEVRGNMGGNIKAKRGKEVMHIKRNVDTKIVTTLVGLVILSGCILSNIGTNNGIIGNSNNASATSDGSSSTTNVSVTVSDACTMSVSGNQGVLGEDGYTYSATIQGGTNGEIIANSIKTSCNDFSGFSIYAIGYSNDTLGNTDLIYNNTAVANDYNIKTDASGTYDSYWKMKLTNVNTTNVTTTIPTAYQSYGVIPNDYTLVAQYNANTGNTDTTASIITPSYEVHIASAQPAGTYNGKVKYTLVHPMSAAKPEIPKCVGYDKMQDIASLKDTLFTTVGQQVQLCDVRDEKIYTAAKLADGNIWMTQNLALGGSQPITLTPDDTNITSNWTLPASVTEGDWVYSDTEPELYAYSANHDDNATKYGNYYNWTTAIVDTDISSGYDATSSICPKGWRLPTGGWGGELAVLYTAYDSDPFNFMSNVDFAYPGYYDSKGFLNDQGTMDAWWSSTKYDNTHTGAMVLMAYKKGIVNSGTSASSGYGYSVRCVAK